MRSRTAIALAALVWPTLAAADVIEGPEDFGPSCPPLRCPPGTNAWSGGHGSCSPGCAPGAVCTPSGRECPAGDVCLERSYCLEEVDVGNSVVEVVRGPCGPGGACAVGLCDVHLRCVAPPPPAGRRAREAATGRAAASEPTDAPERERASGCAIAPSRPGVEWAGLVASLAALARRRSRRTGS